MKSLLVVKSLIFISLSCLAQNPHSNVENDVNDLPIQKELPKKYIIEINGDFNGIDYFQLSGTLMGIKILKDIDSMKFTRKLKTIGLHNTNHKGTRTIIVEATEDHIKNLKAFRKSNSELNSINLKVNEIKSGN